jgi:hypothetical protein
MTTRSIGERAAIEARLADLHQCESILDANQVTTTNCEGQQLPSFTKASQNVAAATALLDTFPVPSINEVAKVYQQLKNILDIATTQQAESSLQHRVEAFILTLDHSNAEGQRAAQESPEAGTTSSLAWISVHNKLGCLGDRLEPQVRHQHCM